MSLDARTRALAGCALSLASFAAGAPPARAEEAASTLGGALRAGRAILDLRYRLESVADDAVAGEDALASTLRTAVGYQSGRWRGWSLRAEAEDVRDVGDDRYNNGGFAGSDNGVRDRPVVVDPEGTALLRAYVDWQGSKIGVRLGRDEIDLGDQRFVGAVSWRQHHQAYDALVVRAAPAARWTLFYALLDGVERVNRAADDLAGQLAQAQVDLGAGGRLSLYGQHLDYDDASRRRLSSATLGAEWAGTRALARGKLLWEVEGARQRDAGENPGRIDAAYAYLMLGWAAPGLTVRGGHERLTGDARRGQFNTPLATLHKFNGWADKFLVTPTNGLVDSHFELTGAWRGVGWTARYHDFRSATGDARYGSEVDIELLHKTAGSLVIGLKAALYDADEHAADTEKVMVWASWKL